MTLPSQPLTSDEFIYTVDFPPTRVTGTADAYQVTFVRDMYRPECPIAVRGHRGSTMPVFRVGVHFPEGFCTACSRHCVFGSVEFRVSDTDFTRLVVIPFYVPSVVRYLPEVSLIRWDGDELTIVFSYIARIGLDHEERVYVTSRGHDRSYLPNHRRYATGWPEWFPNPRAVETEQQ